MPDPRSSRIDIGSFRLEPVPDSARWRAVAREDGAPIEGGWSDWVALAHRVLRADELWREREARGDAWDEGFAAGQDAAAVNPYR
ncbi:hypothetical protein [Microbacterium sp. SL75]|uniref:hypothetical protein n=1 Tax=Microbacterium sp. SL75 TaxID=2995140 RepID=UPI00226E9679|nr:hypothetical protein [Microbacterium sp. SL75]WAC68542.1 hypothetical protein OVA17_13200 [Microbacterium sp. SL75]